MTPPKGTGETRRRGDGCTAARACRCVRSLSVVLLLAFLTGLFLSAAPAAAQAIDFQRLLAIGQGGSDGAAEPQQSRPPPEFRSSAGPSAEDYARLAAGQAAASPGGGPMLGAAEELLRVFRARLVAIVERIPDAFAELDITLRAASPTGRPSHFLGVAVFAALLLVVGRGVAELYNAYVARPLFVRLQQGPAEGYAGKLPVLTARVLLTVLGVAIVLLVAVSVGLFFYEDHTATLLTVVAVFATYAALQLVNVLWRMMLAPYLPAYRIPPLDDRQARGLYLWAMAVSVLGIFGTAFCYWISGLGLPREVHVLVTVAVTLATLGATFAAMRANRAAITALLVGRPGSAGQWSWMQRVVAALWAPLSVLYLLVTWGDLAFRLVMGVNIGPERLMVPFVFVTGCALIFAVIMYVVERIFARQRLVREMNRLAEERREAEESAARARDAAMMGATHFGDSGDADGDGDDEGGNPRPVPSTTAELDRAARVRREAAAALAGRGQGMRTFEDLARRVASLVAVGVGAYALIWYWGGSALFAENRFFGIAEDLIDILLIGYVAFHGTRIWLDQKIAEEGGDEDPAASVLDGEGGGTGATRLATLLPLLRNFILVVIAVTVALVAAMELGVNVAPLFAGAGIVGLAIGFGAQTLVRDIISGAFFLVDDAFRKGEYIDVGEVKGTVEKISIRSFQLRHHLGMLHTIPFGEITHLTNFSRDWVMMKLPLRLTYDTDVEKVRKLVKKLGQELLADPTVGHLFMQPLKSQGVIQMEDSAMIVRVKFMTRPGDQWVVRKRVYQDIRDLFAREGVRFAHREVTVRIPDLPQDRPLTEDERRAVSGAASRTALDVVEAEMLRPTGTHGPVDDR